MYSDYIPTSFIGIGNKLLSCLSPMFGISDLCCRPTCTNAVFLYFLTAFLQNHQSLLPTLLIFYLFLAFKRTFSDRKYLPENHISRPVLPQNVFTDISAVPPLFSFEHRNVQRDRDFTAALAAVVGGGVCVKCQLFCL